LKGEGEGEGEGWGIGHCGCMDAMLTDISGNASTNGWEVQRAVSIVVVKFEILKVRAPVTVYATI